MCKNRIASVRELRGPRILSVLNGGFLNRLSRKNDRNAGQTLGIGRTTS